MHLVFVLAAALSVLAPQPTPAPQKDHGRSRPRGPGGLRRRRQGRVPAHHRGDRRASAGRRLRALQPGVRPGAQRPDGRGGEVARGNRRTRAVADLDADTDFDSIRPSDGYKKVRDQMAALRTQKVASGVVTAFTIPEKGLVPEGVAYDPKTKSFFVSSIRKRKIVRVDANGKVSDFVKPAEGGLRSACGIAADPKRRALWVASEAMPHMEGFRKGDPPASALFEFDLDTGRLRREYRAPASEPPAAFDDLALGPDGRVFANDGRNPRIWTLAPGAGAIELFLESDAFRGTQGMAVTPDGRTLYVSDYTSLFRVDLASKRVTALPVPPDAALNGIDGLVYAAGSLYGIQNGVEPNRVTRLELSADGATIAGAKILVMNHPDFDEPTLGVAAEGALYFTANSQGGKFQNEKKPITPEAMQDAVILKLPLPAASASR